MINHPAIMIALAEARDRDLHASADQARLVRSLQASKTLPTGEAAQTGRLRRSGLRTTRRPAQCVTC